MRVWAKLKENKHVEKIIGIFCQGISATEIILAGVLGSLIGVMPLFGVSTLLSTILAIRLKLNVGVVLFFTYALSLVHPFLFIPFIRLGENIYGIKHNLVTFEAIKNSFNTNVLDTVQKLWLELVCGFTGWLVIAIPLLLLVIYFQNSIHEKHLGQNID